MLWTMFWIILLVSVLVLSERARADAAEPALAARPVCMTSPELLSDARLAEIRASLADTAGTFRPPHYLAVVDLLAEVERLRASPPSPAPEGPRKGRKLKW